jgi:transcriptional regulator with XRE-family HTH domain
MWEMSRQKKTQDVENFLASLGDRLQQLRKTAGWTQKQLAERLGVDWSVIRNYEHGLSQPPAFALHKLANVFNVSVDYLVDGQNQRTEMFHDKELLEFCLRADGLDLIRRGLLKEFIDTLLLKADLERGAASHPEKVSTRNR